MIECFDGNPIYRELYYKLGLVEITRDLFWIPHKLKWR